MKSPRIRILYLAQCWPTGRMFGSKVRTKQISSALQALGQVDFVVVKFEDDDDSESGLKSSNSSNVLRFIKLFPLGSRSIGQRLRCGFDSRFVGYYGQSVTPADKAFLLELLPQYDLVWLHQLRTANVFGQWSWARSVMDLDDVPSALLSTARKLRPEAGRWLRDELRINVAKRREQRLGERFSVLSVCSENDRDYLGHRTRVHVIPNGFARPATEPSRKVVEPPRIGFIAAFGYAPNSEGIRWFAERCWPRIKREVPEARLRLVGKGSDGPLKPAGPEIDGLGWVEDPGEEIATWSAMIVPVRTGGGTRVKVAEGFSRKCPIVATSLGAFGYEARDGHDLLLVDTPEDFANACVRVLRHPVEAAEMAERAWRQFLERWTWEAIRPRVWAAADDCLRQSALAKADL